jgi:hypothetical protein
MDKHTAVGVTFPLKTCDGRTVIGWGSTLDAAISDALRQINEHAAIRLRVYRTVAEYANGVVK